jgi:hypothetical protein
MPKRVIKLLHVEDVGGGQKLSHYRGQFEPPASLPNGAMARRFGEVMSGEWGRQQKAE